MTKIEWTRGADGSPGKTWNPIVGCTPLSAGCQNCYASQDSPHRFPKVYDREGVVVIRGTAKKPGLTWIPSVRVDASKRKGRTVLDRHDDGTITVSLGKGAQWTGELRLLPWVLSKPLERRKPTTYFVNSLSDIFHESLVDCEEGRRFIAAIFGVMAACPQHTFQLLTKRPGKAREWFSWFDKMAFRAHAAVFQDDSLDWCRGHIARAAIGKTGSTINTGSLALSEAWPLPNVWIGTSVEDQRAADERIPELLKVPAALRFLSVEPLLGPVDLSRWIFDRDAEVSRLRGWLNGDQADASVAEVKISWCIVGGESGPKARPCELWWIRKIVEQCKAAGVPCFVKQIGAKPVPWCTPLKNSKGGDMAEWPEDLRVQEMPGQVSLDFAEQT